MGSTWSREVVEADYLSGNAGRDRHCALATYFTGQALDRTTNDPLHPNLRKLAELPYQQTLGELWDDLFATLTDFTFLERKYCGAWCGRVQRRKRDHHAGIHRYHAPRGRFPARIDLSKVTKPVLDISTPATVSAILNHPRAMNFAVKHQEVLIKGGVNSEAIIEVVEE